MADTEGDTAYPMASIRAVLLDADGVIQLPRPTWRASLEALCGDPTRAEDFLADVFAAEAPCLTGSADFEAALAAVLREWRCGVVVGEALRIWTEIDPCPDMLDLARRLRSFGIAVALATNQQAYRASFMTSELGYAECFDHLLYSCELGHAKPSPEYFSSALARTVSDPAQALFIDDHPANVAAARRCGLKAEVYHLSEGVGRIHEILEDHGVWQ